jgi:hypothetical protein
VVLMGFPKTLMGLIAMMVFVGYLVSLMFGGKYVNNYTDRIQTAQTNIQNAANGINESTSILGSVNSFFSIFVNFFVMVIGLIIGIFVSLATFISTVTLLPIVISQIIVAVVSIGIIFAILSKVIQT